MSYLDYLITSFRYHRQTAGSIHHSSDLAIPSCNAWSTSVFEGIPRRPACTAPTRTPLRFFPHFLNTEERFWRSHRHTGPERLSPTRSQFEIDRTDRSPFIGKSRFDRQPRILLYPTLQGSFWQNASRLLTTKWQPLSRPDISNHVMHSWGLKAPQRCQKNSERNPFTGDPLMHVMC